MMTKAQRVVAELFGALFADLQLLPPEWQFALGGSRDKLHRARVVADYIAGMTDRYAIDEHERLFDPRRLR
jgi:dGTPase